jgi:hypothetical protein
MLGGAVIPLASSKAKPSVACKCDWPAGQLFPFFLSMLALLSFGPSARSMAQLFVTHPRQQQQQQQQL